MNGRLSICAITGGTSGIGLATAQRFAREGFQIAVCGRDQERLRIAGDQIRDQFSGDNLVETIPIDLAKTGAADQFIDHVNSCLGGLDVLVNNAAVAPLSPLDEMDDASFDSVVRLNIAAVFRVTRAAWRIMKAQQRGIVVNVSSQAAVDPFPGFAAYGSSKAWIELFTKALAGEGRTDNIRTYCVRPGAVETPMLRNLFAEFPADQTVSPEEVAECIWSVCQQGFATSSGQIVSVSRQ